MAQKLLHLQYDFLIYDIFKMTQHLHLSVSELVKRK